MNEEKEIKRLNRKILINDLLIIFFIGMVMNILVIMFNGIRMPAFYGAGENIPFMDNSTHFPFTDFSEVNYGFLSDIITIFVLKVSIGDILMVVSIILILSVLFYHLFLKLKERRENKNGIVING